MYLIKMPVWFKFFYKDCIWSVKTSEKKIYLTFDDGPHPVITPFVLDELKKYNAKATFFCIGKNVKEFPETFERIIEEGHSIGNHTNTHVNAWKTDNRLYLEDVAEAKKIIDSRLFRPPYGKISNFLIRQLQAPRFSLEIVMWSIISGDFDTKLTPDQCIANVNLHAFGGAIIVYHDSEKAFDRLKKALPSSLSYLAEKGYIFEKLDEKLL